jgi:integrase
VASIRTKKTGSKAIQIVMGDGARRTIGRAAAKAAESFRHHIGVLESASIGGHSIEPATAKWASQTKLHIRKRLEELGLIEPPAVPRDEITIDQLVDKYLAELDTKPRTVTRYRNQLQFLKDFDGGNGVAGLTAGDGERFLKWLRKKVKPNGESYSQNYVAKIVKTSRQAFAFGKADNLLSVNPLAGVSAPERVDEDRDFEITHDMTDDILEAANPTYRLVIALARYGGLRCPSELVGLRWSHILWDKGMFIVHSPKTEHFGKATRRVPIFSELRHYLLEAQELAQTGRAFRVIYREEDDLREFV